MADFDFLKFKSLAPYRDLDEPDDLLAPVASPLDMPTEPDYDNMPAEDGNLVEANDPEDYDDESLPEADNSHRTAGAEAYFGGPKVTPATTTVAEQTTPQLDPQAAKYKEMLDALKSAQAIEGEKRQNIDMLRGSNQIAQALASYHGAKIGDGSEQADALTKTASKPVDDLLKQYQLQKYMQTKTGPVPRTMQQSGWIDKRTGGPAVYNPNLGYYVDVDGGKVPADQLTPNKFIKDAHENIVNPGMNGTTVVKSSQRQMVSPEELNEQYKTVGFNPDKQQTKAIDAEKKRLDTLTGKMNEKIDAATRINQALDGDLDTALSVIKTQMPRLAGEVGNLNQAEQDAWTGALDWASKAQQFGSKITTSKLLDKNRVLFRATLIPFLQTAVEGTKNVIESSANGLAMNHKVPADYFKQVYGSNRVLSPRMNEVLEGKVENPDSPEVKEARELLADPSVSEETKAKLKKKYKI